MEKGDDPYEILEITPTASLEEIKKAYRKLALKHHPDRQPDPAARDKAQDKFAKISAAYEILSDDKQRKIYDTLQEQDEEEEEEANPSKSTSTSSSQGKTANKKKNKKKKKTRGYDPEYINYGFNSPYEVFKRDFEEQFGFPYPGAQFDDFNPALKDGSAADNNGKNKKQQQQQKESTDIIEADEKPRNSFFGRLFGRRNKDETAIVVHKGDDDNNNKSSKKNDSSASTALSKHVTPTETAIVKSYGVEGDNRPYSMETTTKKIVHDDGTVETITETKMQRPDGSIEKIRISDRADKRKDWMQRKDKPKGEEPKDLKRLTNGESRNNKSSGKLAITNGEEKRLAITDGKTDIIKKRSTKY